MRKRQKESLLVAFLHEKIRYERLGEYITRLIKDDPLAPKHNFHTITYRVKDERRFIEKIDKENTSPEGINSPITVKNFQERIGDLLGIRLICLRLADIKIVEAYFQYLIDERIFRLIEKPVQKGSFILPIDPGETISVDHDLMYSGYSSIHYKITLGDGFDIPSDLEALQVELQLRTILEEAWGEIDHKYRYAYSRSGIRLPEYVHSGFYNLSAYLQAAAMQAEYLCRQVEEFADQKEINAKTSMLFAASVDKDTPKRRKADMHEAKPLPTFQMDLEKIFGFQLTERTLVYIFKRLQEGGFRGQDNKKIQKILNTKRLQEFKTVFRAELGREPFADMTRRNVDAINAVNFTLVDETQGSKIALEGLRSVLKYRRDSSGW
jgi:ppGpp synthetase/RelA/SpoT-type nucleotidyltranferase